MSFGMKLKDLRLDKRMTLRELGEILGVSKNTIFRWEQDSSVPRKGSLKKLAEVYGVPYKWLVENSTAEGEAESPREPGQMEDETERQLLWMYRKLSDGDRCKVLGFIMRLYAEEVESAWEIKAVPALHEGKHAMAGELEGKWSL